MKGFGAGGAGACCGEEGGCAVFAVVGSWFWFSGEEVCGEAGEVGDVVAGG